MENLAFFGELLKTFRQRQHLTQQALTEQLGVIATRLASGNEETPCPRAKPWRWNWRTSWA